MTEQFVQPDIRIPMEQLSTRELLGTTFVVHAHPGCPVNAVIEICEDGANSTHLKCWACHKPLTPEAADHVLLTYRATDRGTFTIP